MSHPTGNANVRQAALAFADAGLLGEFWTCIAHNPGSFLDGILPNRLKSEFRRRSMPDAVRKHIRSHATRELIRLLASRLNARSLIAHERGWACIDAVYRDLDEKVACQLRNERFGKFGRPDAVYHFEDGALATFQEAERQGMTRLYDLPIGYWKAGRELQMDEAARVPEWACTLIATQDSTEKFSRKDEELRLSSKVLVATSYTATTLEHSAVRPKDIRVVPYGFPPRTVTEPSQQAIIPNRLRVLFVGGLSQRKGLSYLFAAAESCKSVVELTIIGQKTSVSCPALDASLTRHRWLGSIPHKQVFDEMSKHDVLVFPSLFEGYGLVIAEAMAQGLAVITTPHTAGPDLIDHGRNGFIVPIRSSEAICAVLESLASDPHRLRDIKVEAWRKAGTRTWDDYRRDLVSAVLAPEEPTPRNQ